MFKLFAVVVSIAVRPESRLVSLSFIYCFLSDV